MKSNRSEGRKTTITYIGGPTALIEIGSLRLLTDPTFDPAGTDYKLTKKLVGPALSASEIGRVDVVLLSHDQHADNIDEAGRLLAKAAGQIVTTPAGAGRLGGNAVGLQSWQKHSVKDREGHVIDIFATPARHGPEGCESKLGDVTGFIISWEGQEHGAVYFSGDTVWYDGVAEIGRRIRVGTALVNLGAVQIDFYGPDPLTMSAVGAVNLVRAFDLRTLIPLHFEGWAHYRESRDKIQDIFTRAGLEQRVHWPEPGIGFELKTQSTGVDSTATEA